VDPGPSFLSTATLGWPSIIASIIDPDGIAGSNVDLDDRDIREVSMHRVAAQPV